MIDITLCDDNKSIIEIYSNKIKEIACKNNFNVAIHSYYKGESLLFDLEDGNNKSSIYILDINMGELNGIETAREIRKLYTDSKIIFLTVNKELVFESFEVMPMDYLLKDNLNFEKLELVLLKAFKSVQEKGDIFTFEVRKSMKYIKTNDILFFEVNKRIVTVTYNLDEKIQFYSSIEKIEEQLKTKNFIRVHRSFVVNLRYIKDLKGNTITLLNDENIPIGIKYSKIVRKIYSNYLLNKAMMI
ncbi:LytR/AlgR family response regulator transcription factor [Clostridium butyricum]|uniref:LytR/AlgR family response regulator transcription factor n=1 Tax=Clostridium butyricum TaxID=1492 RepID=UPI0024B908D7|nr:LytTR family DNA-binding domain-containing protein [Clostridium butyricum]